MFDWVIHHARIVDGLSGEQQADLCLQGERIAALLPPDSDVEAVRHLDASGLVLMPGIVDIHRHADLKPFSGQRWFELAQGITSMISGNCGFSPAPNNPETFESMRGYATPILGRIPDAIRGMNTRAFYDAVEAAPLKLNCGYLVGNGELRRAVAGFSNAPLTGMQLSEICALLDDALAQGAMGLSLGLMYVPECYYSTEELAAIAKVAARYGRPVIAHIRGEGRSVMDSVDEMIAIGKASGARVHISHMKAAGTDMWGHAVDRMLEHIRRAQAEGMDLTFDAYPYTAGSTTLLSLLPPEALEGGTEGVLRRISVPEDRADILRAFETTREGWDNFIQTLGWGRVIVSSSSDAQEVGLTIAELAEEAGTPPGEYALDLLWRERGNVAVVLEEMDPEDVRKILTQEDCIVISDALYSESGMPHPRKYGAFQRFLCQYVKEEKCLTLQQAIDKITRRPAEFLGIRQRGRVEPGYYADLVLMDWAQLQDQATYTDAMRDSLGIAKVFVNGRLAVAEDGITGEAAGVLLNRVDRKE